MPKPYSKKRRLAKKRADNEFTRLTGIEAIQLSGSCQCLVTKQSSHQRMSIGKYAYLAYNNLLNAHPKRVNAIRVRRSCGVDQCVQKEHLVAYDPHEGTPPGVLL